MLDTEFYDPTQYLTMNKEYGEAILAVMKGKISSPRGMKVIEINDYVFTVDNPLKCIATKEFKPFHTRIEYAEAELAWYISGSKEIKDLVHPISGKTFGHLWEKFSDDGYTVNSAYGQYIFAQRVYVSPDLTIPQWMWIKSELRNDPDSRRAIINVNQPVHKNLLSGPTKDFPCCVCLQFTIRDNKLNLQVVFRSQDVDTGLRNDVFTMCGIQRLMAEQLEIECGTFTNIALNLHMYEPSWKNAELLKLYLEGM